MNVEYTQRNYEITPAIKKQITAGISKFAKLIGTNFEAKAILSVEKHRSKAEITLTSRLRGQLIGVAEADDMSAAVDAAFDRLEAQALKNKERWRDMKRQPKAKEWSGESGEAGVLAVGAAATTAVPVAVHSFPNVAKTTVAHLVKAEDAIALRPMALEEAIKECEFRDREVFVFRDANTNETKILHRRKDGKLELIELP